MHRKKLITPMGASFVIAIVALGFLVAGCTPFAGWKPRDKVLFGSYLALSTADAIQTNECRGIEGCQELNPLLQDSDDKPDMLRVAGLKLAGAGLVFYLINRSPESRTINLVIMNILQGGVIVWNAAQRHKFAGVTLLVPVLKW